MEKIDEKERYPQIAAELGAMVEVDQDMRKRVKEGEAWGRGVDESNTQRMKEIVEEFGWPTISKFGLQASKDAWLLVQHADLDPEFQEHCLTLMKEAGDDVPQNLVAYLEDRVRVNTGQPQLYGTQFTVDDEGVFGPRPIEDAENLDLHRTSMGLEPFKEYESRMIKLNEEWVKNHPTK